MVVRDMGDVEQARREGGQVAGGVDPTVVVDIERWMGHLEHDEVMMMMMILHVR